MISFLIYCNVKFDLKNNFFSENLTSATTRSDGSSHPKTLVVDNYETQTQIYAIKLSVDENDVDMQSQNSDLSSSGNMEVENGSDDNIEYWLNDALEKINMTSDSSENKCRCRNFSNKYFGTYLKSFKVRGHLMY